MDIKQPKQTCDTCDVKMLVGTDSNTFLLPLTKRQNNFNNNT